MDGSHTQLPSEIILASYDSDADHWVVYNVPKAIISKFDGLKVRQRKYSNMKEIN